MNIRIIRGINSTEQWNGRWAVLGYALMDSNSPFPFIVNPFNKDEAYLRQARGWIRVI